MSDFRDALSEVETPPARGQASAPIACADRMAQAFPAADRAHMARALELAARGLYTTTPNPRVGCVIVRDGDVIGEGFHERAGEAHAEVERARGRGSDAAPIHAARRCTSRSNRATRMAAGRRAWMRVLAAGIARVVAAMADPNPRKAGGARRLRAAGIAVELGL